MRFLIAAISAATFLATATPAQADKRVAFVVGNGTYKSAGAAEPGGRRQVDGQAFTQCRFRGG